MAIWGTAALLLLLPFAAMQFTGEVNWNGFDFIVMGAMLAAACGSYELAMRMTANRAYRAAAGIAIVAAFVLVWINLAVGIIGSEENPANLMYAGVLAVAAVGAGIARLQPHGMARALLATALAQALVTVIALMAGMGHPASPPLEILGANGMFAGLWLVSAWLFHRASTQENQHGRRGTH